MTAVKFRNLGSVCVVVAALLASGSSRADNLFGEFKRIPDQIERGFSIGFDFGLLTLMGQPRTTSAQNPGFNLAFTTGYDIMKYLGVEGIYMLGINQASPQDPVLDGSVLTFLFNAAVKGQYPLGRFYPFVEFGPGIHYSKPDWEDPVTRKKVNKDLTFLFAGGMEYYTYLRHFSLYVKATYNYIKDAPINTFVASAGLKYTF